MRLAATLTLALAALVVAATASARDPKRPQLKPSKADVATARAIGLVRSDFAAGWKRASKQPDQPPCSAEPDESKLVQTAAIDPTFVWRDGLTEVGSEVDVFRTAAQARLDWRLSTLAVMRDCLLESARRQFGKGVEVKLVSAVALPAPRLGERSLHYRITVSVSRRSALPIVAELIGVGAGRTSVLLHAFSLGSPLPARGLSSLAATLAERLVRGSGGV